MRSRLEILTLSDNSREVVFDAPYHLEAPNWALDGKTLIFNSDGCLFSIPTIGGKPEKINTFFATHCNNDHVLSPDGEKIAISHSDEGHASRIYILPITGGLPRLITENEPSYLHGWSPDGKTLAYCAQRHEVFNIYTIDVNGGPETRLTYATGLDDGPEYSPDGKYIYFNSDRTGTMHIYRMLTDGSQLTQLTFDEANNWFAHVSPDSSRLIFVSYKKEVKGHPANQDVELRIMPYDGGEIKTVAKLFGGQGTLNVPSWSPDSKRVAFVSYEL